MWMKFYTSRTMQKLWWINWHWVGGWRMTVWDLRSNIWGWMYLSINCRTVKNVGVCWARIKAAVKCVEDPLAVCGLKRKENTRVAVAIGHRLEVDVSEQLQGGEVSLYQQYNGVLWRACQMGRVDILLEVALMLSHKAMPKRGRLEALYSIFAYLRKHEMSTLVFDDARAGADERRFTEVNWTTFRRRSHQTHRRQGDKSMVETAPAIWRGYCAVSV
jgi:hypothetical protein